MKREREKTIEGTEHETGFEPMRTTDEATVFTKYWIGLSSCSTASILQNNISMDLRRSYSSSLTTPSTSCRVALDSRGVLDGEDNI